MANRSPQAEQRGIEGDENTEVSSYSCVRPQDCNLLESPPLMQHLRIDSVTDCTDISPIETLSQASEVDGTHRLEKSLSQVESTAATLKDGVTSRLDGAASSFTPRLEAHQTNLQRVSSSARASPKHYSVFERDHGISQHRDSVRGNSLYRCLAKILIGDYLAYGHISDAVLHFALEVRANEHHPLHAEYMRRERDFTDSTHYPLFTALESPDFISNTDVLWTIAMALRIRLSVYGRIVCCGDRLRKVDDILNLVGEEDAPAVAVLQQNGYHGMAVKYAALVPDDSGRDLVELLLRWQENLSTGDSRPDVTSGMQTKRFSWVMRAGNDGTMEVFCDNTYREGSHSNVIKAADQLERHDTWQTFVRDPRDIAEAISRLQSAMRIAPNQGRNVRTSSGQHAYELLRTSVDLEFKLYPAEALESVSCSEEVQTLIDKGEIEPLASTMIFNVGGRYITNFCMSDMLENPTEHTVAGMHLLAEFLFDPMIIKLWWNLQKDMTVLCSTFAHLHQLTPRKSYYHTPYRSEKRLLIAPRFHLQSSHFNTHLPDFLRPPSKAVACELHTSDLNEQGIACPCLTGNIDIAAVLALRCRQQGLSVEKLPWFKARPKVNFEHLLKTVLGHDRLFNIMLHNKHVPDRHPLTLESRLGKVNFYQKLSRPGMELDDEIVSYLSADSDVPNRVYEQLCSTSDPQFAASALHAFANAPKSEPSTVPRKLPQRLMGYRSGIPLYEENPKLIEFNTKPVLKQNGMTTELIRTDAELLKPKYLQPWEHDRQVRMTRQMLGHEHPLPAPQNLVYEAPTPAQTQRNQIQHAKLLRLLTDPNRMLLPKCMIRTVVDPHPYPPLRFSQTTTEALFERLRVLDAVSPISPPPGFGAIHGTPASAPVVNEIVPGAGLHGARDLAFAHSKRSQAGRRLGQPTGLQSTHDNLMIAYQDLRPEALVENAVGSVRRIGKKTRRAEILETARQVIVKRVEGELEMNAERGLPGYYDPNDVLDPEGREYRRNGEGTQHWNQPVLPHKPLEYLDGSWMSMATLVLQALESEIAGKNE